MNEKNTISKSLNLLDSGYLQAEAPRGDEPLWHRHRRCPMTHAKRLWSIWQALLLAFAWAFTGPSFRRFAEWVTAMAINGEEHTITQSVLALESARCLEGAGILRRVRPPVHARLRHRQPDPVGRDRPRAALARLLVSLAVDDTKVHRNSPDVWGTCTFHEYTARMSQIGAPPCGPTTGWCSGAQTRQTPATPSSPARRCFGTALLPEIPVASSIPGLRSHRSFPDQM